MKTKLFVLAILTCSYFTSSAQIEKGTTLIGGQFSFNNTKPDTTGNISSGNVQLKLGKAISENVIVGVYGGYSGYDHKNENYNPSKGNSFSAGVFGRLYKPLGNNFYFFGESGMGYARYTGKSATNDIKQISSVIGLSITPGFSYKVLDWAHLELTIPNIVGVNYSKNKTNFNGTDTNKSSQFTASSSLSNNLLQNIGVGFSILFSSNLLYITERQLRIKNQ